MYYMYLYVSLGVCFLVCIVKPGQAVVVAYITQLEESQIQLV